MGAATCYVPATRILETQCPRSRPSSSSQSTSILNCPFSAIRLSAFGVLQSSRPAASKARNSRAQYYRVAALGRSCAATTCWTSRCVCCLRPVTSIIYVHWKAFATFRKKLQTACGVGETVDPDTYYFRATPYFETSSEKYGWLNRICAVASGSLATNARTLDVFQVR